MKVYFLGTGTSQGIPVIGSHDPVCLSNDLKDKRLRSSVFVDWDGVIFQIDCGPDFRQQMLQSKCSHIDALLFTHEHADHTAGLDDIRSFCFQRQGAMPVYAQPRVIKSLEKRFDYIFATEDRYPGVASVQTHPIEAFETLTIEGKEIETVGVLHGSLPILGYKLNRFAYLTDVKSLPIETIDRLQNIDVLVINALRIKEHPTHNHLEAALAYIEQIKPQKAYITHIGYELGFHEKVQKSLPKNVYLAYDNLEIEF